MIESFQNKKAMLIGNGLNLLDSSQSFSWGGLLEEIKTKYGMRVDLDNIFKPFPLTFDEMQHTKLGSNSLRDKLKNLKQNIRSDIENQLLGKNGFNNYHRKLALLEYDDILTTNYDYSLEKSVLSDFIVQKKKFAQNNQERKLSLKRCYKFNIKTKFWHIHGELFDSRKHSLTSKSYPEESIMIGYEHYTAYLEKIQENIKGKGGTQKTDNQSLTVRIKNSKESPFWTDIFFTHNLDIIGQTIDFSENHLWWIFNYRANLMREGVSKNGVHINNVIRFFYPEIRGAKTIDIAKITNIDDLIRKKNSYQKSKAIAEVLQAFQVIPISIECDSHAEFYDKLISNYLNDR
jgi:hypothetical protein